MALESKGGTAHYINLRIRRVYWGTITIFNNVLTINKCCQNCKRMLKNDDNWFSGSVISNMTGV